MNMQNLIRSWRRTATGQLSRSYAERAVACEDPPVALPRWLATLAVRNGQVRPKICAVISRCYRNLGHAGKARRLISDALLRHPRDVRLLVERAVCDNFPETTPGGEAPASAPDADALVPEIVICVHNALEDVKKCLHSIITETRLPYYLTIINDRSEPQVRQYLCRFEADHGDQVRVLHNDANLGYTKSANRGLKAARTDWVVLLNSDTIVTRGWLDGLRDCALSAPGIAAVGPLSNAATFQSVPQMRESDGRYAINPLPDGMCPNDMAEIVRRLSKRAFPRVPMLNGFCLALFTPALQDVGYLNEDLYPRGYGEENDLCLRLLVAGRKLAIADHVYVHHARSASFGHDHRRRLSQEGNTTLKAVWPGYRYALVADAIAALPQMRDLRQRLTQALAEDVGRERHGREQMR